MFETHIGQQVKDSCKAMFSFPCPNFHKVGLVMFFFELKIQCHKLLYNPLCHASVLTTCVHVRYKW